MSEDGAHGLTLIAFVGSVFSPYYAWARRRGPTNPENHCAFNVALYSGGSSRWTMTERGASQLHRERSQLAVGPSCMRWTGEALEIRIDEVGAPLPRRVRGTVRLIPAAMFEHGFALDDAGQHRWTPFAPQARVEVSLSEPALSWSGLGYFDSNCGDEPLERSFTRWTWSRAAAEAGTVVLYDVNLRRDAHEHRPAGTRGEASRRSRCSRDEPSSRGGVSTHGAVDAPRRAGLCAVPDRSLALNFAANEWREIEPPPLASLPKTGWRVARQTRADAGCTARVVKTLEDAPFYSRTVLDSPLHGVRGPAIHESLDLDRFSMRWVQCLLPFRMPRFPF